MLQRRVLYSLRRVRNAFGSLTVSNIVHKEGEVRARSSELSADKKETQQITSAPGDAAGKAAISINTCRKRFRSQGQTKHMRLPPTVYSLLKLVIYSYFSYSKSFLKKDSNLNQV